METPQNIVVIGGGPAGTFAAIAARKQQPAARVGLLNDEPDEPYEKPPLSKGVLTGKAQVGDAPIAGPGGIAAHGVALERPARCASIDRARREIVLEDGRHLPYDRLVLATGARVRELPVLPSSLPGVYYLRHAADAEALRGALGRARDLIVVGGGLIGLEVAASAAELGVRTHVLEVAPQILARVCYAEVAEGVHAAHRERGVDIRLNTTVTAVEAAGSGTLQVTAGAERLAADLVVVGTGARPDDALAAAAGLAVDDGILVDAACRTSDPLIFAAGDAARFPGPFGTVRLENWRHALDQGTIAGRNAAGGQESYSAVPSFWSEQYDLYIQGVGWPRADAERIQRPLRGTSTLVFEVHDGRLIYALGINAQRELAVARRLIERRTPVDPAALADPDQPLATLLKR